MNTFEIEKGYFKVHDSKTAYPLYVDKNRDFSNLLEPEAIYQLCQSRGLDEGRTINVMLKQLHRRRIFKGDWLGELDLCIAFIGPRGSGKSVGATGVAILDGLLAGRRVVSNMPIAVKVKYRDAEKVFQTEDIDATMMLDVNEFSRNYFNVMVVVDEVNVYLADSMRSTSNQALFFSYILQQMRHRQLDFIFTTQSEMWQTNRMRFQTDFYVKCMDYAMLNSGKPKKEDIGRKSRWEIHDMSGLVTGEVLETDLVTRRVPPFTEKVFWNTPFWNCYSTELMQKREKHLDTSHQDEKSVALDKAHFERLAVRYQTPTRLILQAINMGMASVPSRELWEVLGITGDRGMQTKMGRLLKDLGCTDKDGTNRKEYIFPTQAEMLKRLNDMGLSVNIGDENGE